MTDDIEQQNSETPLVPPTPVLPGMQKPVTHLLLIVAAILTGIMGLEIIVLSQLIGMTAGGLGGLSNKELFMRSLIFLVPGVVVLGSAMPLYLRQQWAHAVALLAWLGFAITSLYWFHESLGGLLHSLVALAMLVLLLHPHIRRIIWGRHA